MSTPAQDLANAFYTLSELEFLHPYKKFPREREALRALIDQAKKLSSTDFQPFTRELVQVISTFCHGKAYDQGAVYRAFDGLDDVLAIDYLETKLMMPTSGSGERLYEGGGTGVQTSYSTIVKVLEHLKLPQSSHLVDLGSGFGRVGLTTGLWREDLRFSGYEFVSHRVAASNAAAARAGVGERVLFIEQDLSDPAFQIPAADAYYLYDPFSVSTYELVFRRISELGREQPTTVIAKAGARAGFQRWVSEAEWHAPETVDEGTILLYRSRR